MQYQGSNVWSVSKAAANRVCQLAILGVALVQMAWAQPLSLAKLKQNQGDARVVDVRGEVAGEELSAARTAYRQGNIVKLTNASDDVIHRVAKGAFTVNRGVPREGNAKLGDRKVKSIKTEIGERFTALRLDPRGVLHQFTGEFEKDTPANVRAKAEADYRDWELRQVANVGDTPQPPDQGYWTPILSKVYQASGVWGTTQSVIRVFRLNENDTSGDYYMVITDPTVSPNVKTDVASSCYGLAYVECGWWTSARQITMSTTPASILLSHGPNTPISTSTVSWTLGGVLSVPPGLSGAYTESWNQDSVTTADQSSTQNGVGHWVETFSEIQEFKVLPPTAVSVFVSHQGAIFQVADASTFTLNVLVGTTMHYFTPPAAVWEPAIFSAGVAADLSVSLSPPDLSLTQNFTTIAPGGNGSMQIFADVLGGDIGLDWAISNVPPWASLTQLTGTGTTSVGIQVAPGTPLGTTWTLNVDSAHAYASPSTVRGPLKFEIKVGQPDLHGALLIGGARIRSGTFDSLGSGLFYSAKANDFVASTAMNQERSFHTSTALLDGTVLVAGGRETSDPKSSLASAEIYDPATTAFTSLSNHDCPGSPGCMITAAWKRVATRLDDGKVLFTGGTPDGVVCTAAVEVYDPVTRTFRALPNMSQPRCDHTAALTNGKVLIGGGVTSYSTTNATSPGWELFDPATGQFSPKSIDEQAGWDRTATPMPNGVLLSGGFGGHPGQAVPYPVMGIFNDRATTMVMGVNPQITRVYHTATRLQDGRVLFTGGRARGAGSEFYTAATAEIYDPSTGSQYTTLLSASDPCPGGLGCMVEARAYHTATLLLDGRVLISGGVGTDALTALRTTEIFDPKTNSFSPGPPFDGRVSHTAVQLRAVSTTTLVDPGAQTSDRQFPLVANVKVDYPEALSGSVTFTAEGVALGSAPLVNGTATISVKLPTGKHPVTAQYAGSESFAASVSESVVINVASSVSSLTLSSDKPTTTFGQQVTFAAALSANGPTAPSGTITFFDAGTELASVPITGPTTQFSTSDLAVGSHTITAVYSGDTNYQPSNSNALTQAVNALVSQVTLVSSANPSPFNSQVTFTANVVAGPGEQGTPSGEVVFLDGTNQLGVVSLVNGSAAFPISTLAAGAHKITARYRGDNKFGISTSDPLDQTIGLGTSTTGLTAPKNPVVYGQDPVVLQVTVSGPSGAKASGTVSLLEGATVLATGSLDENGGASLTVTAGLSAGIHNLSASYAGSATLSPSNSHALAFTVDHATTETSLTASPANPTIGQTVTLTAKVSGAGNKQTGNVKFLDGAKLIGNGQLNAGTAVATVNTLGVGSHSLTAVYDGDANYASSTSAATALTVQAVSSSVSLVSSLNPATLGNAITLTATVSGTGGTPTGKVAISQGGAQIALLDLVAGSVPFTLPKLAAGTYSFTAAYQGDATFGASTSSALAQVINGAQAPIRLSSSQNPSVSKSPVTFTAILQGLELFPPSGSVTFLDGATSIGTGTIANGQAVLTTSTLSVGSHNISASWAGDENYAPAKSPVLAQVVNPATSPSVTSLSSSKNPATVGESVSFSVKVQAQTAGANSPVGSVTLMEGAVTLGSAVLSNGGANIVVGTLSEGSHSLIASYSGDANFATSSSAVLVQVVNAAPTASVVLTSQTNPSIVSATTNLVATVKSVSGTPTGSVVFRDGATVIGTVALANGVATLPTATLSVGMHNLVASYAGDGTYPAATSAPYTQQVNPASSNVALTSSQNPASLNQAVTFRAVVTSIYKNATGTVTFYDGATVLGSAPLTAGAAIYTTSALSGGSHSITAKYSGETNVLASTSPVLVQVVNAQFPVTVVVTSSPNPSTGNQVVTFTITVTSTGGGTPTGNVTLSETAGPNSIYLGNADLVNGSAKILVDASKLSAGSHVMYGTYSGDATHLSGTSQAYVQQVTTSTSSVSQP